MLRACACWCEQEARAGVRVEGYQGKVSGSRGKQETEGPTCLQTWRQCNILGKLDSPHSGLSRDVFISSWLKGHSLWELFECLDETRAPLRDVLVDTRSCA